MCINGIIFVSLRRKQRGFLSYIGFWVLCTFTKFTLFL
nr:MAG TPA: hypothetical protein [Caudoviricetes sp.]